MDETLIESMFGAYRWEILIFSPLGVVAPLGPEANVFLAKVPVLTSLEVKKCVV